LKKNTLILISSGFLLLFILTAPFTTANDTTQWFPDEETEIEYAIRQYWTFLNGTDAGSTRFDVFYQSSANAIFLRPVQMRDYFPSNPHTSKENLANNTEVKLLVNYEYGSSTHLTRTKKLIWETGESNSSMIVLHMIVYENGGSILTKFFDIANESIQRNNFPDDSDFFIDYTDNQLGVGECLDMTGLYHEELFITAVTSDSLIAFCTIFNPSNSTYVFGLDGRTKSFDLSLGVVTLKSNGISSSTSQFSRINPEPELGFLDKIPWDWVLIGVAGVELIIIVILAVMKKRKT
jgi:hypothetical protein